MIWLLEGQKNIKIQTQQFKIRRLVEGQKNYYQNSNSVTILEEHKQ